MHRYFYNIYYDKHQEYLGNLWIESPIELSIEVVERIREVLQSSFYTIGEPVYTSFSTISWRDLDEESRIDSEEGFYTCHEIIDAQYK